DRSAHARCGSIAWRGDGLAFGPSSSEPRGLRPLNLSKRLGRRRAERRASLEVRNVGNVAAILVAPEDVDVVILQEADLNPRLYRSTNARTCRTWYGLHLPSTSWMLTSSAIRGCTKMWWLPLMRASLKPNAFSNETIAPNRTFRDPARIAASVFSADIEPKAI